MSGAMRRVSAREGLRLARFLPPAKPLSAWGWLGFWAFMLGVVVAVLALVGLLSYAVSLVLHAILGW